MKAFPVTEFKLSKYATFLSKSMKTTESIKSYCSTLCEQNELQGFKPVRRGVQFYKAMAGIKRKLRHRVKRASPLTTELLSRMQTVVNVGNDKEMVTWLAVLTGFHLVLRKSNLVPIKRMHDTMHNITRNDVHYADGVMVIDINWSKTNQLGQPEPPSPLVGDNNNPICPVRWLLYMIDRVPAYSNHNLFSYCCDIGHTFDIFSRIEFNSFKRLVFKRKLITRMTFTSSLTV